MISDNEPLATSTLTLLHLAAIYKNKIAGVNVLPLQYHPGTLDQPLNVSHIRQALPTT
jgi:hypothetical protein